MWYVSTIKYHSAFKKGGFTPHVTTWTNLEDVMLSKISQSPYDKYCIIPFT